jgi:5-methylcytosine-specific restriction endonuclease McrA
MKEDILKLRAEGRSYNEIQKLLGCSKSTIAYHCGKGQKDKTKKRQNKRRQNVLLAKIDRFKYKQKGETSDVTKDSKDRKDVVESIRKFQKRDNSVKKSVNKNIETTFTWEDVIEKYGENTFCYLSGEELNLFDTNYQLDHIIPASRGGSNGFSNLGITHKIVNQMKGDLTPEELIDWCKKILTFNDYEVNKK